MIQYKIHNLINEVILPNVLNPNRTKTSLSVYLKYRGYKNKVMT